MKKLNFYGIRGTARKWLESYLTNIKQFVEIKDAKSKTLGIKCGVPQGFDCIECFTTTFLRAHSWLNWVDEDDDEHDEVGLKEKPEETPEDTRYIKKITSK